MLHSYSTPVHNVSRLFGWATLEAALLSGSGRAGRVDRRRQDLQVYRLICLMVVVLLLAFGAVYKLIDTNAVNSFVPELVIAFGALAGLAASYRSPAVQRRFVRFVQGVCFLTTAWFVALAAANGFAPNFAVGLLFIIPGIGVGYSLSLQRMGPLAAYFAAAIVATAGALRLVPDPGIVPGLFVGSLVCISGVTLLVAGARLHAQKRFLDSEERYRAVVEQASDGICLLDASTLRFLDANPAYQRMVGYDLAELRAMTIGDLVVVDRAGSRALPGYAGDGRHAHVSERKLRRKDGTTIHAELHIDRITYAGRDVLSMVVQDVSRRRQYETSLIAAKENAEEIARFKSSLLTNMSHEIRTPLSSILGWSAVLSEEVGVQQRELVALIEQSGKRLHTTLDAVLELAHLDARGRQLDPCVVDVADEVGDVLDAWRGQAERKGVSLLFHRPASRLWAELDAASLRRILTHLVDNAVKFTDAGGVAVWLDAAGRDLRIQVRDTGAGIGEAFMPHLFEEFKQESEGLSRDHEGNGLGLAITRRLVDLLGGTIDVESRKGEGSCFTVTLPGVVLSREAALLQAAAA